MRKLEPQILVSVTEKGQIVMKKLGLTSLLQSNEKILPSRIRNRIFNTAVVDSVCPCNPCIIGCGIIADVNNTTLCDMIICT